MRRSFFPLLLAILVLLGAGAYVGWIFFHKDHHPQLQLVEVPESYLETSDTSSYSVQPIDLKRSFSDDSVLLLFPASQRGHEIFIYDSLNYDRLLFGDRKGAPMFIPSSEGLSAIFGRPVLNHSGLANGKYYVHVTDCNFAGFFEIELEKPLKKPE